ncbi:MogA/MoaB family molybdenum cofactor biosynthesis protein [Zafaria sp. Z1313]|uniref:MogA/MoaB family molybdenum cofactor biosynthesis protein n=1 Tax=unclassified Zafaria TaxID=2828765 RepID=UPI002E77A0E1|nr:MogA/MoaB family molybdenum cofactor biosynthesis protein [Zafaria sp. J156]MEE1621957.1 MogA/MoaB family molybdenum cofactor biosynthesis protein [Zafaria sp. J156]
MSAPRPAPSSGGTAPSPGGAGRTPDTTGRVPRRAAVLIASTRAAAGIYEDRTAPIVTAWLRGHGFEVADPVVVADGEPVRTALRRLLADGPRVVLTSGGTGVGPDDATPEMTRPLLEREVPGIMEAVRAAGREKTPHAALGRGLAGTAGSTFIVNLPGSPRGVTDALAVLDPLIGHLCDQLEGIHGH